MSLETKIENPVDIKFYKEKVLFINGEEELDLYVGVVLGGEHYGFNLDVDGKKLTYGTQCRIDGIEFKEEHLRVYEANKTIPWRIKRDGTVVNTALFSLHNEKEREYLKENFGIIDEAGLADVNETRGR